jgi:hypothetical protein
MEVEIGKSAELTSGVKDRLFAAGYQEVLDAQQHPNFPCDFVAYAAGPNGAAYGTAVQIKRGPGVNFDLEAANLDLARIRAGVTNAILITDSEIYDLEKDGSTFRTVDEIPRVSPSPDPLVSQELLRAAFWQFANNHRGATDPGDLLSMFLSESEADNGTVSIPGLSTKFDGEAFRAFYSKAANTSKFRGSEGQSSPDVQSALSLLSSLFPSIESIFDPFFGLGLTTFAALDALRDSANVRDVFGFEVNLTTIERAKKLGNTVKGLRTLDLQLGSSVGQVWPSSDLLLSEPPLGLRLPMPILLGGVTVRDYETYTILRAAIEVCETGSRKGAILLTSRTWLSRERDQMLRNKLVELGALKAVLGLPGLKANTSIPLAATIITRGNSEAIIGDLLDDWQAHLSGEIGDVYELLHR